MEPVSELRRPIQAVSSRGEIRQFVGALWVAKSYDGVDRSDGVVALVSREGQRGADRVFNCSNHSVLRGRFE